MPTENQKVKTNLGRVSIVPKGVYDPVATYERLDYVLYGDDGYLARKSGLQGITPEEGENWMKAVGSGSALAAKSWAIGEGMGDKRPDEATNNAKYYAEQAKLIYQGLGGPLLPMGTIRFSDLSSRPKAPGYMYNISDAFTTNDTFMEGEGHAYPAGTNVYYTGEDKWDCLAGAQVISVNGKIGAVIVHEPTEAEMFLAAHPVGALYVSFDKTSPAELYGGAWEQIKDRFVLAAGDAYNADSTGGAASVTSGGTAISVAQMPAHSHLASGIQWPGEGVQPSWGGWGSGANVNSTAVTSVVGGGQPHTHTVATMPPYIVAYVWRRVA